VKDLLEKLITIRRDIVVEKILQKPKEEMNYYKEINLIGFYEEHTILVGVLISL
jgi:hypothetical protein